MAKKFQFITTIIAIILLSSTGLASQIVAMPDVKKTEKHSVKATSNDELQKIIDDFRVYASGISVEIREEVKKYRIEIAKINNQKRDLYKKISQEAQNYLAKEQEYKKRMSVLKKAPAEIQETPSETENKTNKSNK
jgi:hypothetical protein